MSQKTNKEKFVDALKEINYLIESYMFKYENSKVIESLIIKELYQLRNILGMIYEEISERDELHEVLYTNDLNEQIYNRYNIIDSRLRIHFRAIYLWLYNLKILIDKHSQKNLLVTGKNKSNLEKYCEFRHKLITHKVELKTVPLGGTVYTKGKFDFRIMMTPINAPDDAVREVNEVFENCKKYLSDEDSLEKNFHTRLDILYRNLTEFGDKQKEVLDVIEKYGTYSDEPIILVEFIRDLCKELLPKLNYCYVDFNPPPETGAFFNRFFN